MYSHISKYQDQKHKLTEVSRFDKSEMLNQTSLHIKPRPPELIGPIGTNPFQL